MTNNNILQDLSSQSVALALDANIIAYNTLFSSLPQAELHNDEGLLWFETGIDSGIFNGVLQTRQKPEELPVAIERVLIHFQQRNLPFHWHVGPSSHPTDIGNLLESYDICHDEDLPGMAVDLLRLKEDIRIASNLIIHPVTTDELLHQWTSTWGCGAPDEEIQRWFMVYSGLSFGPERPLRLYLGTIDEKPVATVALFLEAGVASINWVVTIPEFRHQGIGAAMTLMAAREARSVGYRVGVLVASPMGINVYRRLGFSECCVVSAYEWNPTGS
ncbi:MAG: GNAT family N-acetyltransferase [Ktedonobacteraceae bacterium]